MAKSKKKRKSEYDEQLRLAGEIFGVLLVVVGILFGICVFSSSQTVVLSALRSFAFGMLGAAGYVLPFIFAAWGFVVIFSEKLKLKAGTATMCVVGVLSIISLIHLLSPYGTDAQVGFGDYLLRAYQKGYENIAGGGLIGALTAYPIGKYLGKIAGAVVYIALILISIMAVGRFSLKAAGRVIGGKVKEGAHHAAEKIKEELPKREERLRERVEQRAFRYDADAPEEDEDEGYSSPKGTAYNELLQDEGESVPEEQTDDISEGDYGYEEDYQPENDDFSQEQEESEEQDSFPFDTPPEYELYGDDVIDANVEDIADEPADELDLAGLRIIDRMHGRSAQTPQSVHPARKKSYDFTVDADDATAQYEQDYSADSAQDDAYEQEIVEETYDAPVESDYETDIADDDLAQQQEYAPAPREEKPRILKPAPVKAEQEHHEKRFILPSPELLDRPRVTAADSATARREIDECAVKLEDTFASFGVDIKVVNASRGPKVTRYELQPAAGVKIAKIKSLGDDIALNMAAESVRIEAPIPGKSVVGIELPNKSYASVCVRELIDCPEFKNHDGELPFALGKDIAGKKIYDDLAKMPHLLVAGTTGSGKSVCLNTIIMSLIYKLTPAELQFIMIDPKMVEMAVYNGIPNLKVPVVMDKGKAAGALVWAVAEMEKRYKLFQQSGVRNIKTYNKKMRDAGEEIMAKLVIVIDEFADLMMVSAKDVEDAVCRIAQLGRAAGIHLIIATQSPRADIFTGLIKANVPSRIALTVGNALESRIIMDEQGAEKLLGYGDMLYRPVGKNKATRVQGCFVSDDEIYRVTEYLKSMGDAQYDDDVDSEMAKLAEQTGKNKPESAAPDLDADADSLLPQAAQTVLEFEQASASMLQRKMRVGYSRAARLMDQLEDIGVVGPSEGSKGRQILWTWADYNEHFGGAEDRMEDDGYED